MRRRTVLFESWRGRYADSPRAISERLSIVSPSTRQVWAISSPDVPVPGHVRRVRRNSPAYFALLGSADVVISNDMMSRYPVKAPWTTYVQTWHGTPLKRIGFDIDGPTFAGAARYQQRLARDVGRWDYLVSPSPGVSSLLRQAFRYAGPVLETGYPRNDVLLAPTAGAIRQRVREQLGVAPHQQAVLYAPTWRDDEPDDHGFAIPAAMDCRRLGRALGPDTVLLLRMHNVVGSRPDLSGTTALDVSDHPDIGELYLAADVLVTDYSSVMFDFAVTGKPMVFFCYDLARYRDEVRGFYFDLEDVAPGPVVRNLPELTGALCRARELADTYRTAYSAFRRRFCPLDDGHATDRLLDGLGIVRPPSPATAEAG